VKIFKPAILTDIVAKLLEMGMDTRKATEETGDVLVGTLEISDRTA